MLAIKFYNLQALVHRPLLSPSRLFRSCTDPLPFYQNERPRIVRSKKKCVSAAQNTARLLHDVPDKKQLIYGFPWWQMISCLICASSILLVARLCMGQDEEEVEGIDWLTVDEDADVCLAVFGELSSNSNAARLAQKMMQGLKETRLHPQSQFSSLQFPKLVRGPRALTLKQQIGPSREAKKRQLLQTQIQTQLWIGFLPLCRHQAGIPSAWTPVHMISCSRNYHSIFPSLSYGPRNLSMRPTILSLDSLTKTLMARGACRRRDITLRQCSRTATSFRCQ